mgnify:CR=1 FL=1
MNYVITGRVEKGAGYGRKIGYPTVNIHPQIEVKPLSGVYAGLAELEGKIFRAGIVIGPGNKVEAHLIGYSGDAYGLEISLEIKNFLREFKKFDTEEELITQIKEDLKYC